MIVKAYREKLETELAKIRKDNLAVLDKHLVSPAVSEESKVFYYKLYVNDPFIQ